MGAGHQPALDWIVTDHHHDWNRCCCLFGVGSHIAAVCEDNVRVELNQLSGQVWEPVALCLRISVLDRERLSVSVTGRLQPLDQGGDRIDLRRIGEQDAKTWNCSGLFSKGTTMPCCHCAEPHNKSSSSHVRSRRRSVRKVCPPTAVTNSGGSKVRLAASNTILRRTVRSCKRRLSRTVSESLPSCGRDYWRRVAGWMPLFIAHES